MSWYERAACKNMDTRIFFPEQYDIDGLKNALAICSTCPVKRDCLEEGLDEFGIWGGMSHKKRAELGKRMRIPYRALKPIVHGTHRGRQAHIRRGETPCEPCRLAYNRFHTEYTQRQRANRREGAP